MKKLLLASTLIALAFGSASFAGDTVEASAASNAGQESSTLGGAGSIGNGAAASGSSLRSTQYSAGIGIAGSAGKHGVGIGGAATSTVATGKTDTLNGSISTGQAGGFSGSATGGGSSAKAKAKTKNRF